MKTSLVVLLTILAGSAVSRGVEIANSITEFTATGTQGENGWSYGYRDYTLDGGGEDYDAGTDFIAFDELTMWRPNWRIVATNAPWTFIGAEQGHPNGTNNGAEHWAIRRWAADELVAVTPLAVTWSLRAENLGGTGVSGSLHHNGTQLDTLAVAGNDGAGVSRTIYINAAPGDLIDLALTPVGPTGDRTDGSDGSLYSMVIDDSVGDVEMQPDGRIFVAEGAEDDDMDDLADQWEFLFFPGDTSMLSGLAGADFDMDGLPDIGELNASTDPTEADTDGDGLNDFDEFDEHGTDPRVADTDGDGFSDGAEIAGGSNPLDPLSRPVIADSLAEFSGVQGQDGWSHGYRNYTADGGGDNYQVGDFIPFAIEQWTGTIWDLNPAASAPWTELGPEGTHPNGTNSAPNEEHWTIRRWLGAELTEVTPLALVWLARKINPANDGVTGSLHINGVMVDSKVVAGNDVVGEQRTFYANLAPADVVDVALSPAGVTNRTDGSDGSATWLLVSTVIPNNPMQPDGTPFIPATADDTDADNLPDPWEEIYSPGNLDLLSGLGDADNDMDGSSDLEEFLRSTDPTDQDTDNDGLFDGVETGDGTFDGPNDTGTDPRVADSDGDGRDDGDEVNAVGGPATDPNDSDSDDDRLSDGDELTIFGTDPTNPNTDGDSADDGDEVDLAFDPTDPDSDPATLIAESRSEFSGVHGQDGWSHGYRDLTLDGGAEDYDPAADFIPFPSDGTTVRSATNFWDGNLWDFDVQEPWTALGREDTHPNDAASGGIHWTVRRWAASELVGGRPLAIRWHVRKVNLNGSGVTGGVHINGVRADALQIAGNDGVGAVRTYYANVLPTDVIDLILTPDGDGGDPNDGSDGSANWMQIDTHIPPNPLQPDGTPFVPQASGPLQITSVDFIVGPLDNFLRIKWPSASGRLYAVDSSTSLLPDGQPGGWLELDDGVAGEAGETTYDVPLGDIYPSALFVRVRDVTGL